LDAIIDFELSRRYLERVVPRSDRVKRGRASYDHIPMFKALILKATHSLSDQRTEYPIKNRMSFMRLLGLTLADRVPDANSIWNFRSLGRL
jgi:transposase, IS5 family